MTDTWNVALRAGVRGGVLGGLVIWLYEAVVWVGVEHLLPLRGIPANAIGLTFGTGVQQRLGLLAYPLGTAIHFGFAMAWGIGFAAIWPFLRRRNWEATFAALILVPVVWLVMHGAIALIGANHPDYTDPAIVTGGLLSHVFFTVPMALSIKRALGASD